MFQSQRQVQLAASQLQIENLSERIETINGRIYDTNKRLARVETLIVEDAAHP